MSIVPIEMVFDASQEAASKAAYLLSDYIPELDIPDFQAWLSAQIIQRLYQTPELQITSPAQEWQTGGH